MDKETLVRINNCQNITSSEICIQPNTLNIKYGLNGTGKSTIAKAIHYQSTSSNLLELKSFGSQVAPSVEFSQEIKSVLVFNEEFVNDFVFLESEVLPDSFEILLKSPEYEERKKALDEKLSALSMNIAEDEGIASFLRTMTDILNKLPLTKTNDFKQTPFYKAIIAKQNIFRVPEPLRAFRPFFERTDTIDWIEWKGKGFQFDDAGKCPFCIDDLKPSHTTEKEAFNAGYNKSSVKNIIDTLSYFETIKDYLNEDKYKILHQCIKESLDEESIRLNLLKFRTEIEYLQAKISNLLAWNSYRLTTEDISRINHVLENNRIDSDSLDYFKNERTLSLLSTVNSNLDRVLKEVDSLKTAIGALKGFMLSIVKDSTSDINGFLESAGINYRITISVSDEEKASTVLKYIGNSSTQEDVSMIRKHLSWGERNAFALSLFSLFVASKNPDLIILDDPISSFDANKKYAIANRLFSRTKKKSLANRTVLLLTHDFQPLIDFIYNQMPQIDGAISYFLENTNGHLIEKRIDRTDIQPFPKLMAATAKNSLINPIIRILSLRKYIEHTADSNANAYNILSCLLHCSATPNKLLSRDEKCDLTELEVTNGEEYIQKYIADFCYKTYLDTYFNISFLTRSFLSDVNRYHKIIYFRIISEIEEIKGKLSDDTIVKYVNEQFHIENDYLFGLDMLKFDIVPYYYVEACNNLLIENGMLK